MGDIGFGWAIRSLLGLQTKASLTLAFVVVVTATAIGVTTFRRAHTQMLETAVNQARQTANVLAAASAAEYYAQDRNSLIDIAQHLIEQRRLLYVAFVDTEGQIVVAAQRPNTLTNVLDETGTHIAHPAAESVRLRQYAEGHLAVETQTVIRLPETVAPDTPTGSLLLAVNLEPVRARLADLAHRVIELASAVAIMVIAAGFLLLRRIVRPINQLSTAALELAHKHEFQRLEVKGNDEIASMTRAFNHMADRLLRSQRQLIQLNAELERPVADRTLELQARNEQLKQMASRDSLTGLFNRRYFNKLLPKMFAEARRYQHELACMMIDVDNFKTVNDELGHQAGDALLLHLAEVVRSQLRQADMASRYGGDELVVLLPHSNAMEAFQSARRIREAFQKIRMKQWKHAPPVSLSIGIADLHLSGSVDGPTLLRASDQALYRAKKMGKDGVCAAVGISEAIPAQLV